MESAMDEEKRIAYARCSLGMRWSPPERACMYNRNRLKGGRVDLRGGVESRRRPVARTGIPRQSGLAVLRRGRVV